MTAANVKMAAKTNENNEKKIETVIIKEIHTKEIIIQPPVEKIKELSIESSPSIASSCGGKTSALKTKAKLPKTPVSDTSQPPA